MLSRGNIPRRARKIAHGSSGRALETWPERGRPESAEAWLITVARNAHRDRARRAAREELTGEPLEVLAQMSPWVRVAIGEPEVVRPWKDDLLRLLFACCDPSLEPGESAALALSTMIGQSASEVAAAFVVAPRTMEQRLARARQRLASSCAGWLSVSGIRCSTSSPTNRKLRG